MHYATSLRAFGETFMSLVPRIGIAMGDPAGISPELLAKLLARADVMALAAVTVIGDRRVLSEGERVSGVSADVAPATLGEIERAAPGKPIFVDLGHLDPGSIAPGVSSAAGGQFAMRNFREALMLAKAGRIDGVMFTPFNKLALKLGGNPFPDEIRWAAATLDWSGQCSEYNRLDHLWNARVTSHEPLRDVAAMLTRERIVAAVEAATATVRGAGIARPRIAVAGFNPHAGEGGVFGREEIDVIAPAVEEARRRGHAVEGPFPADTVWLRARRGDHDVVLSMYHDQGQIALKLLGFERGVTVLGGLPVPITTPAHGTAYDIVGRNAADPAATIEAFRTLVSLSRRDRESAAA
jgi:4-hydroxythreonine-4-phosphate dehydrogenase